MNITDNKINFEQTDIDALPVEMQEALAQYDAGVSAAESLSAAVNAFLSAVVTLAPIRSLDRLKAALDAAPAGTKAQVEAKLDEAASLLGIQFLPKPEPKPPTK